MAIKRRTVNSADVEAFGDAAGRPVTRSTRDTESAPVSPRNARTSAPWPDHLARTLTLRYADPRVPELLAELAEADERSQHSIALRALRRGLDELANELLQP